MKDPRELGGMRWVRGKLPPPGRFLILDFWSSWCEETLLWAPCLSRLAPRVKANTDILGIGVWEEKKGANAAFFKKHALKMRYLVALDAGNRVADAYLTARKIDFLPMTFLLDKSGAVLWRGMPFEVADVLEKARAGSFDAKATEARQKRLAFDAIGRARLVERVGALEKAGNWREAEKLIAAEAGRYLPEQSGGLLVRRFKILQKNAPSEAAAYVAVLEADPRLAEVPWVLHDIAIEIVEQKALTKEALALGLRLTGGLLARNPTRPSYWDTHAELLWRSGDRKAALAAQRKAVALLDNQFDLTDSERAAIVGRLARYRRGL